MEPILICQFDGRIRREKSALNEYINHLQAVYDQFKLHSIDPTPQDILRLVNTVQNKKNGTVSANMITVVGYVRGKILPSVRESLNNPHIKESVMLDMIELPDLTSVDVAVEEFADFMRYSQFQGHSYRAFGSEFFELVKGTIKISEQAHKIIEDRHTNYTRNKRGLHIFSILSKVCDALNDYHELLPWLNKNVNIDGIGKFNNVYKPDLNYIRSYESKA